MARISSGLLTHLLFVAALGVFVFATAVPDGVEAQSDSPEPIAYIGHGGFFDRDGRQIPGTLEFVADAQAWYRRKLVAGLDGRRKAEFAAYERRLGDGLAAEGQNRLVLQQRQLEWLMVNSPQLRSDGRTIGKINALNVLLYWRLPSAQDRARRGTAERFVPDPAVARRLEGLKLSPPARRLSLATTNTGQAYIDECEDAQVPIPPRINVMDNTNGTAGWKSQGFIPIADQFISGALPGIDSPAEVRTFRSPEGMCIALPRYSDPTMTTVNLDGVICLSEITSKVCIWDNQKYNQFGDSVGFSFPANTQIPIGVPDVPNGLYQGGGFELEQGTGGVCTDCHAGENPYIIHPDSNLGTLTMGSLDSAPQFLPTFAPNRYIPLVAASWPQNEASQAFSFVPTVCRGCHVKGGAGRFPHLSTVLNQPSGYCQTILANAILRTMPALPDIPGSEANTQEVLDFKDWCAQAATSTTADEGDPHLTTTNGVRYDFQAAGEFTSLRNSDTGFELQTRQSPVLTSFTPGANAYTGLASCVSLNTAAAVRVGRHRITYQPSSRGPATPQEMQLRIDGRLVTLPPSGIDLGDGDMIARAASGGGLDIRLADGTRLLISSNYWSSEGYWYLNIEVLNTRAREGTMGHILRNNWLPLAPNGASFGPAPATLIDRHRLLNQRFADAWRVTPATSLFDYPPGLSTASFTDRRWPPPPNAGTCRTAGTTPWGPGPARRPVAPMRPEAAQQLCRIVKDKATFENCVFDVTATGDAGMAEAYARKLALRRGAGRP